MTIASRIVGHGEEVPDQLLANPLNFRRHPGHQLDALRGSMGELGWVKSVIVNRRTGYVLDGHARVEEAIRQKIKTIPVEYVDLSPEEERIALAVLDPITEIAIRDQDALNTLLADVQATDPKLKTFLESLGKAPEVTILPDADLDAVPEPPADPITKPGDVIELGRHRLVCGDSTLPGTWDLLLGSEVGALLVTDPPYGVSYAAKNEFLNAIARGNRIQTPIENDHKKPEEMAQFWVDAFSMVRPRLRDGAPYYVTGPQGGDLLLLLLQSLNQCGFPLRHMLIWAKNNHVLGRCDYNYKHEPILYGWVDGSHKFYGTASETSLWEIDKPHSSKLHPTMKPVALYERAITNSSQREDIVLDPFGGSGTCIIACEKTNRRARSIELDPAYCDVIVRRWEEATGQLASRPSANP